MQDYRGTQVVKSEAIIPQKRAEELVWWRAESSLIECHKGHHISFRRCGGCRVLRHAASPELYHRHKPMLHEFFQVAWHNGGRSPILLRDGSRRKGRQHL
jgi:hypothetical protein